MKSDREYFNPIEWLERRGIVVPYIMYDRAVIPQYRIQRGSAHDGTLCFTYENILNALRPLAEQRSYFKRQPPAFENLTGIRYIVGDGRIAVIVGMVNLPVGRYPGQRERVTIPVRCEYLYGTTGLNPAGYLAA